MEDTHGEGIPLRSRTLMCLHIDEDVSATVEHIYEPDGASTCDHDGCGQPTHDPGMVGLILADEEGVVSALMNPGQALIIAERLQRAAALVMESGEDVADVEREAARYSASTPTS